MGIWRRDKSRVLERDSRESLAGARDASRRGSCPAAQRAPGDPLIRFEDDVNQNNGPGGQWVPVGDDQHVGGLRDRRVGLLRQPHLNQRRPCL